jgi:hypothetical protein
MWWGVLMVVVSVMLTVAAMIVAGFKHDFERDRKKRSTQGDLAL